MHTFVPGIGKVASTVSARYYLDRGRLPLASSRGRASNHCFIEDLVFSSSWIRVGSRCELGGKKHHADKRKKETVPGRGPVLGLL